MGALRVPMPPGASSFRAARATLLQHAAQCSAGTERCTSLSSSSFEIAPINAQLLYRGTDGAQLQVATSAGGFFPRSSYASKTAASASRAFAKAASMVSPSVTSSGKTGEVTVNPPSG